MNLFTKLYNKHFRYRNYNKETQLSLEDKIEFLKYYNLKSEFEKEEEKVSSDFMCDQIGFCAMLGKFLYSKNKRKWLNRPRIPNFFIELTWYKPSIAYNGYWFTTDEEGWEKRKAICNELLGELEEKQRKLKRGEL